MHFGCLTRRMYNLLLLFGIFISGVKCDGYYFVTAPNVIRYDHEETVIVSVFGLRNATVNVWLQYGEKQFSTQNVVVQDEATPVKTTVKVTENDLFENIFHEKPRAITVCSGYGGHQQCRDVILSYQTGYLIVQTDKPIYTPQQKVKVRTLALDESLRAVDGWQVGMDIISPSNLKMARETKTGSASGFFEHVFTLPPHPETGMWTARAFYMGQFETESRALFEVQEYVLPTFDVTVQVDVPFILQDTLKILVTVKAKYVNGKWVEGNARLTLNLKDVSGVSEYILDISRAQLEGGDFDASVKEFFVNVQDILESPLLRDRDFPAGCRLEIVATVLESATGTEETTSYDGTVFADKPYKFKFSRSKLNFRPGWHYNLKVDLVYANGQPATGYDIVANMFNNGDFDDSSVQTTDSKGHALFIFSTSFEADTIYFTAKTTDNQQESERFYVEAHVGEHQIQVEHRIVGGYKNMLMRASTNIRDSSRYTGMLFMVVTRGKVVYTKFRRSANQASEIVTEELKELISPSARLLVFYVFKETNVLVADSVKFDVDQKCRGDGLKLETNRVQVRPGTNGMLKITGGSLMWVGLNVMDKALLLLNNKTIMRKNKMFEALESHDLGCGEGGGRSSADVFKKTGLTVLTNAVIDGQELQRKAHDCQGNRRRRRDSDECPSGAHESCCAHGIDYAYEFGHRDHLAGINPYTTCYAKARDLLEKKLPMKCVAAYFLSCKYKLEYLITEYTGIKTTSFDDESDYVSDLVRLADYGLKPRSRSDFRESWLFEVDQLDYKGSNKKVLSYPDSITDWTIQAIGITPDKGMCIADPVEVNAFKSLFIQLDLPYKAIRLKYFYVTATIFNYGLPMDDPKTANVYLEGVDDLCYNTESGKTSPKTVVTLKPNSAETVRFSMIPLKQGKFPITVSAIVTESDIPEVDVIRKPLYVVNEGIEEQMTNQICLDPNNQMKDCKNDELVISDGQRTLEDLANHLKGKMFDSLPGATTGSASGAESRLNPLRSGLDVVLVVDTSSSIGTKSLNSAKKLMKLIIDRFGVSDQASGGKNGTRFALVTFSGEAKVEFNLDDADVRSNQAVNAEIDKIQNTGGGTDIRKALNTVFANIYLRKIRFGNHRRWLDAKHAVFIITDAEVTSTLEADRIERIKASAGHLKNGNFEIFSIGVGSNIDKFVLAEIASTPHVEHVFLLNQFKDLEKEGDIIAEGNIVPDNNEQVWRVYTVNLTLPEKSIAGSGSATGYFQSTCNVMDNVVKTILEGVENLFQQPAGNGEQKMIGLAPTVYAMMYLKEKKLITKDIEIIGNQWIREGVTKEVSQYRHPDGSYAAWQNRQASTWLTACVAKVFCQANEVVDDAVEKEKDIVSTINWLMNHVTDGGEFIDHMPVTHKEMIGQMKNERDPSLTAFVLVTLLECDILIEDLDKTINKSTEFLENLNVDMLQNNPYLLAISTYALAMAKSEMKWVFKDLLHKTQTNKEDVYWGNAGGKPASAHAVESTAYALLAMLELEDFDTSAQIVRWLISQRDAKGSFRTTQDTVVGLQALSRYSILTASSDVNLKVELYANHWKGPEFELTCENAVVQQIAKNLPVEHGDNNLTVRVTGTGTGRMIIDLRYNRPAEQENVCPFDISYIEVNEVEDILIYPNLAKKRNCDICGRCEQDAPPWEDYPFEEFDPPEGDLKTQSNFDRRKRQANREVRATSTTICIRFSVSSKSDREFGKSIVNFGLETGVEVVKDDLDKLVADNPNIARYEMPSSGKGFVVFYLQQITSEETHFIFRLKDGFESNVKTRQPSLVKVYDYYNPDESCTQFYGTGPNHGKSIAYECDRNSQQCQCLQTMCIQETEEDIISKTNPDLWLYQYSCNPEKANYAVLVTIGSVIYDQDTTQLTALGIVKESINQGIEQLDVDDAMTFFWSLSCDQPDLEEGRSYYIIGRYGNKFRLDDGDQEYRYPLMGTAVVIKERYESENKSLKKSLMYLALQKYKRLLKDRPCQT